TAGVAVAPASGLLTIEAGGSATFPVLLTSEPTGDVVLTLVSSDATEGTVTGAVRFTPINWNVPQTVVVMGMDDAVDDGDIDFTVATIADSADPNYSGIAVSSVSATNIDDDT